MRVFKLVAAPAAAVLLLAALVHSQLSVDRAESEKGGQSDSLTGVTAKGAANAVGAEQVMGVGGLSNWTYLGPNNIGGPTSFVGFRPENASVAYAVSQGGDVYRSDDAGGTWSYLNHVPLRNARLEFAAGQPETIYAYAEQVQALLANSYYTPLFKSTDGGQTWKEVRPTQPTQQGWLYQVRRLRTVQGQPGVLWATTYYGLARSSDDGATWSLIYTQGGPTQCGDLELSSDKVYAVCPTPAWNVISASIDGVGGWSQLTQRSVADSLIARLAVAKNNPAVMYLATFGEANEYRPRYLQTVMRSTDSGATWETRYTRAQATDTISKAVPGDFEEECAAPDYGVKTYGGYETAVDPVDSNQLWIAGYEIFRSEDGGASFGRARARKEQQAEPRLGTYQGLHSTTNGYAAIAFAPNYNGGSVQMMLAAGGMGIERTENAHSGVQSAANLSCNNPTPPAIAWTARNNGYAATRLVHGSMSTTGELVASGPDIDVGISDGSGPDSWASVTPLHEFLVGQTTIDPVHGLDHFGVAWMFGLVHWQWDASSNALTGSAANFNLNNQRGYVVPWEGVFYRTWFFTRFARDPNNLDHFVSGSDTGVFESRDGGHTWQLISPNIPVVSFGFKRDGAIIAATSDGFVLSQMSPGSHNWQKHDLDGCVLVEGNSCSGKSAEFSEFALSPNPADQGIYATAEGPGPKVWYSADGRSWQARDDNDTTTGLTWSAGTTTLAIDPDNPAHLYAGTQIGLYTSDNNGETWTAVETPFPQTPVSRLEFHKRSDGRRTLVAFTYGRGAWSATVAPSTTFVDVPTYSWAHDYIQKIYLAGITKGCSLEPALYCGSQSVARDQMAVFLLRAMHDGTYQPPAATGVFSDVPTSHWAASWIEQLRAEGITSGCATNPLQYCPGSAVTRDQMAVFLLRAKHGASYQPPAATGMFADVPANYWAAAWIEQLAREGVTSGCSSTPKNYCPASLVTRDQMAAFLTRAFGL